ncbi:RING-H2 finger protein ATL14-like [Actinidia eriantha]|uniref:RING-H2 finger protein ATL14-like n=1 Tax=Actinidia eriantha TaxID=165200 RepID=UPI00258B47CA|nr:RING-H2 finger protein ATL14-like [Actinidia eriantha]
MSLITSLFFLFLGIAAAAFLQFFLLHRRSSASSPVNLPRQKYASGSASSVKEDCAVCLEAFRDDQWCRSLPKCRHLFHAGCVDRWLTKVANCPVCRPRSSSMLALPVVSGSFVAFLVGFSLPMLLVTMGSNKERIENLEAGLSGLRDGVNRLELGVTDKLQQLEVSHQPIVRRFAFK